MFRGAAYYWLDEPDPYFDHFEADVRANNKIWLETLWYPAGRVFRQHPRFREAAEAVGLVALWRQRGWPDLCRPEGDSFSCD